MKTKINFAKACDAIAFNGRRRLVLKIIFSRKGVDSAAGKCASALIHGRPISLPIPTGEPSPTTYGMLNHFLTGLASDLSKGKLSGDRTCHLDPDIDRNALAVRPAGWRGALGQAGASLSHLRNQSVGTGDLFLFWGLYRPVDKVGDRWNYIGPRQHSVFGWLMIEAVHDVVDDGSRLLALHPWLADHPHVRPDWTSANAVYVAAESFELDGRSFPGSGVFTQAWRLTA